MVSSWLIQDKKNRRKNCGSSADIIKALIFSNLLPNLSFYSDQYGQVFNVFELNLCGCMAGGYWGSGDRVLEGINLFYGLTVEHKCEPWCHLVVFHGEVKIKEM